MTMRQPPEWAPQQWLWIGFPHDAEEWHGHIDAARSDIIALANAVQRSGTSVRLVVRDEANAEIAARSVEAGVDLRIHRFGDVWLRDTGPLIVSDGGQGEARLFDFNGWGGKYKMDGDREIGAALAAEAGLEASKADWVLEGGAIDIDGTGTAITTEQCLLNPNRNPAMSRSEIESALHRDLGIDRLVWLGEGLHNDHTDGHVDNLARFVAPGKVALPQGQGDDPNHGIFADARQRLAAAGLEVVDVPSPGRVEQDGEIAPASYMNFVITDKLVVVPIYDRPNDAAAVAAIGACFPGREVIGLPAHGLLTGGGSFHCASQQMPVL